MADDDAKRAARRDKKKGKSNTPVSIDKAILRRRDSRVDHPPVQTEFIQKLSNAGLDKFIQQVLEANKIDDVKVLDLSRQKLSELSDKVKFYLRMLRKLEVLNLYANKLRTMPPELGMLLFLSQRMLPAHPL
jgi:hypothetical protein